MAPLVQLPVSVRALGWRKSPAPQFSVPIPPEFLSENGGEGPTLRELITHIVLQEVAAFEKRQRDEKFIRLLTEKEMETQAAAGKIAFGGNDLQQKVEPEAAVGAALQAFEDGIYLVILDGEEQRNLDQQVWLHAESHIVFVRLVMLAGG